jgi:DNA-binding beta-propeller fold protein YncE
MRAVTFVAIVLASSVLASTSSAGAAQLFAPIYYPDEIAVFNTAFDGTATELAGSPFPVGTHPTGAGIGGFAFAPDGDRAVVSYYFNGGIQGLNVAAGGQVTAAQPIVGDHKGGGLAVSPDGKFAYQAVFSTTKGIDGYAINQNGSLTALPGSPFDSPALYQDFVVSPDGKSAYATTGSAIRRFVVNVDGTLTPGTTTASAGASQLLVTPDGRQLVVLSGSNVLSVRSIAADGSLGAAGSSVTVGSTSVYVMAISPEGDRVFAVDYNGDTLGDSNYSVNTYAIGADSGLLFVGAGSTGAFRGRAIGVSPDARFIYLGSDDQKLIVAPLDANGVVGTFRETGVWDSGEPIPFVFRPVNAPSADLRTGATPKPLTMTFDASKSTSPDGSVDGFEWDFGDGGTGSLDVPSVQHKFPKAGVYNIRLTAVNEGCSTQTIFTGHTTVCNGSAGAAKTLRVDTPPWITSLKVSPSKVSRRTKIKFKLTETATITLQAQRAGVGRVVGGACKKQTRGNRKMKRCTRWLKVGRTISAKGRAGRTNTIRFNGKIKRRKLTRGSYRFVATAKDSKKQRGPSKTASFKIRR